MKKGNTWRIVSALSSLYCGVFVLVYSNSDLLGRMSSENVDSDNQLTFFESIQARLNNE